MKNYFLIIILISNIFLFSCRAVKQAKTEVKTIVTERIIETVRDSMITLPADSSWLMAYLECDSLGQVNIAKILDYESGKRSAVPKINIDDNILTAYNECEELEILIRIYERYIEALQMYEEAKSETITVNELKTWQVVMICMGFAWILLILYKIYNFFKNIF